MISRRSFATLISGAFAAKAFARTTRFAASHATVQYSSAGPELAYFEVDVAAATLLKKGAVELPSDVQYACPDPTRQFLYVSSSGGPELQSHPHYVTAFSIDRATGALKMLGAPVPLRSRPIHNSVDNTGKYLLVAYNAPSGVSVHVLLADGAIGAEISQPQNLDCGFYGHQIRATPSNRTVILVTRGSDATTDRAEDPGALKVFGFNQGLLENKASVQPGNGIGFGPRHLDFHPTKPWVFVSVERQNQLQTYALTADGDLSPTPLFVTDSGPPAPASIAGPIHVHPNGKFVYLTNRGSLRVEPNAEMFEGRVVRDATHSNVAVFAIDQQSGEPSLVQTIDAHGAHPRTFALDAHGRILVAARFSPVALRQRGRVRILPAGLSVFRIAPDGRLSYARGYDIELPRNKMQWWSGIVGLS
jgi:6-phosphogluconolactonase